MNIQYCSDLHLEFRENKAFLKANPLKPVGDILVLAGDVVPFALAGEHHDFFAFVADHFELVYWLPGNHEYYGSDIAQKSGVLQEKIRSNVFLVNHTSIRHKGVTFIFSTLWSKISPASDWLIEKSVSDFQAIRHKGGRFSPVSFNQLHEEALHFIQKEISEDDDSKTIVVTHHVPTFLNYPPQYKGSVLNEAFAVELFGLIERSEIDYWIFGHHHVNTQDFTIGKTQLLTNQLGYVQNGEHRLFDPAKMITV
jgi:3',5'-cyclic AMP phosphodiesterase CpdA